MTWRTGGKHQVLGDFCPKRFVLARLKVYVTDGAVVNLARVVPQARAELRAVQQFVKAADASGLQITEAGGRLLSQEPPQHIFGDRDWEYSWPQEDLLETLALAQHHGMPTRLLDFTEDPLVGAYFAACSAWNPVKRQEHKGRGRHHLAVWVVDSRFIRALNGIGGRYPERIGEVRVPRANNAYLHAQSGFFLMDRGANDAMARRMPLSLDEVMADRAGFWHYGDRLVGKGIKPTWFDKIPVRQVRLHTSLTGDLLRELANRGITRSSLMPSLDRVAESMEFQRSIP